MSELFRDVLSKKTLCAREPCGSNSADWVHTHCVVPIPSLPVQMENRSPLGLPQDYKRLGKVTIIPLCHIKARDRIHFSCHFGITKLVCGTLSSHDRFGPGRDMIRSGRLRIDSVTELRQVSWSIFRIKRHSKYGLQYEVAG